MVSAFTKKGEGDRSNEIFVTTDHQSWLFDFFQFQFIFAYLLTVTFRIYFYLLLLVVLLTARFNMIKSFHL